MALYGQGVPHDSDDKIGIEGGVERCHWCFLLPFQ